MAEPAVLAVCGQRKARCKVKDEPFEEKMVWLTGELSEMFKRSHELEDEIRERLNAIGYDI
jgi:hypothetical protein